GEKAGGEGTQRPEIRWGRGKWRLRLLLLHQLRWFPFPSRDREDLLNRIALAAVAGAQGVKGEVRLKLFGDSVESLARHHKLFVGGVEKRLISARDGGKTVVARF